MTNTKPPINSNHPKVLSLLAEHQEIFFTPRTFAYTFKMNESSIRRIFQTLDKRGQIQKFSFGIYKHKSNIG